MTDSVILDTDFIYSLFFQSQSTHDNAKEIANIISDKNLIILNHVKFELLTVLSKKESQTFAIETLKSLKNLSNLNYYFLSQEVESEVYTLFESYKKKNISTVDCANLVIAKKLKCKIASFDKFYPKEFLIS